MTDATKPLVISAPDPRTLDLIFSPDALQSLRARYEIVEIEPDELADLPPAPPEATPEPAEAGA